MGGPLVGLFSTSLTGPTDLCNRNHPGQPDDVELVKEAGGVAISSAGDSMRMPSSLSYTSP